MAQRLQGQATLVEGDARARPGLISLALGDFLLPLR